MRTLREDRQPQSFLSTVRKILEDYKMMTGLTSTLSVKGEATSIPASIQLDLTRIIQESITNSVRHGQANECSVILVITDSNIDIFIKDNGTGATTVSPGFGLKNMRERVHEHGGSIMFESAASNGFIVKHNFHLKRYSGKWGSLVVKLLIVDDQELMRDGLATILNMKSELEVVGVASNGQEAFEKASDLMPDIVLMDIRMPVANGVEGTKLITSKYPGIKVLMLTTFHDSALILKRLKKGRADIC